MWICCYDCGKEAWWEGKNLEDWNFEVYKVQPRDMTHLSNEHNTCDKCGVTSQVKWGHPSMKIFLCP